MLQIGQSIAEAYAPLQSDVIVLLAERYYALYWEGVEGVSKIGSGLRGCGTPTHPRQKADGSLPLLPTSRRYQAGHVNTPFCRIESIKVHS